MTRVHLVRHGRTASNRERRTMGWLDEGIEPGWVRAAAAVADVLAQKPVDWLVSSPLARAVQTAAPLAALLSRQPIVDDRFGELRVGHRGGIDGGRDRPAPAGALAATEQTFEVWFT